MTISSVICWLMKFRFYLSLIQKRLLFRGCICLCVGVVRVLRVDKCGGNRRSGFSDLLQTPTMEVRGFVYKLWAPAVATCGTPPPACTRRGGLVALIYGQYLRDTIYSDAPTVLRPAYRFENQNKNYKN